SRETKPIETTKPTTDPPHGSSTTDTPPPIVRLRSCVLRDRGMIQTHHQSKPTTTDGNTPRFLCPSIPPSIDSLNLLSSTASPSIPLSFFLQIDVVGIVAKLSKLSETPKDKKICCSYRINERLVFHQIYVTDPVKKNGFYSGRYTFHC
ncbi:unnamed protein product, partial [Brassica rapa subsp. narinosa]